MKFEKLLKDTTQTSACVDLQGDSTAEVPNGMKGSK